MKNKFSNKSTDNTLNLLLASLLGMLISIICLVGTSWAWVTDNASVAVEIPMPNYSIEVVIVQGDSEIEAEEDGSYILNRQTEGNGYSVTITVSDESTVTTGYCLINGTIPTKQLKPRVESEKSVTFTLYPAQDNEKYSFVAVWGIYSGDSVIDENQNVVGSPIELIPENTTPENTEVDTTASSSESQELEDDDKVSNALPANPNSTDSSPSTVTVPESTLEEGDDQSRFSDETAEPDVEATTENTATE